MMLCDVEYFLICNARDVEQRTTNRRAATPTSKREDVANFYSKTNNATKSSIFCNLDGNPNVRLIVVIACTQYSDWGGEAIFLFRLVPKFGTIAINVLNCGCIIALLLGEGFEA